MSKKRYRVDVYISGRFTRKVVAEDENEAMDLALCGFDLDKVIDLD